MVHLKTCSYDTSQEIFTRFILTCVLFCFRGTGRLYIFPAWIVVTGGAEACFQRLRWWLGRSSWRRIRVIDEIAMHSYLPYTVFNTLRPRQDGCLFADDILKCILLNLNSWIPNKISWKYVAWRLIDNKPYMVQIMGCRRAGDNPIIWTIDGIYCETRPRWVRDGDRGDHPSDIYVSVIISLLYSYLLYTVF